MANQTSTKTIKEARVLLKELTLIKLMTQKVIINLKIKTDNYERVDLITNGLFKIGQK